MLASAMDTDRILISLDNALRTLSGAVHAARPCPKPPQASVATADDATGQPPPGPSDLTEAERRLSGSLMRVNHVGEVCAQALYQAQALTARDPALRARMAAAAREEIDHLAWTQQRLDALGDRRSWLNPLWYAGAFGIGLLAGRAGDAVSLGFVVETERQVEQHLASHLDRLPAADTASRAIVDVMQADERRHAEMAQDAGAAELPAPVRWAMQAAARVMTATAHRI